MRLEKEHELVNELRGRVESAFAVVQNSWHTYDEAKAKKRSKEIIGDFRFGDNNYLWVHRLSPTQPKNAFMLVHPLQKLVDKDLSGWIDLDKIEAIYFQGKIYPKNSPAILSIQPTDIFAKFNQACLTDGEGVIPYYWPKIIDGKASREGYRKVSFVKYFAPWHWVIGAGAYADHIDTIVLARSKEIQRVHRMLLWKLLILFTLLSVIVIFLVTIISVKARKARILAGNEQRRQKEFMETVLNSMNDAVSIIDVQTYQITKANHAFYEEYGVTEGDTIGKTCHEITHNIPIPCSGDNDFCPMAETVSKGKHSYAEHTHYNEAGQEIYVEISTSPIFGDDGTVLQVVHIVRDITERKKWAKEIEKKNDALKNAYEELGNAQVRLVQREKMASVGQLAAGVAHEINNPMGFITSNLGTLTKYLSRLNEFIVLQASALGDLNSHGEVKDARKKLKIDFLLADSTDLLTESLDGAERITEIVANLKDFSRVNESENSLTDINACMDTTLNILRNQMAPTATIKKGYGTLPPLLCNPREINHLFVNILLNASQSIEDSGEITITTELRQQEIVISISDTGCGIPQEQLEHIFEPFFTTRDIGSGTGIGLSACFDIVHKLGGEIEVTSEEGSGTMFTIKLPIHPTSERIPNE